MCKTLITGILQTQNQNTITYTQLIYVKIIMESLRELFALHASEAETLSCSSTKFEIPALKNMNTLNGFKLLGGSTTTANNSNNENINKTNEPPSKLNEFLLAQLQEKRNNGELQTAGFTLPKLLLSSSPSNDAASSSSDCKPFVIPLLHKSKNVISKPESSVAALSKKVQDLHVTETASEKPIVIDLTTALSTSSIHASPLRRQCKTQSEDFDIPFIECDRVYSKGVTSLPTANEYCLADASAELTSHKMAEPSPLGRIICLHYGSTEPLPVVEHSFKVKHVIVPFRFDTLSPDDKVLKSLKKF